ncbi:MAG: hypothetical protein V1701_08610 [Planctomycetota bacterium]
MRKLIYYVILMILPALVNAAEIESVKIGWDGNYRIGYWCPVNVNLKTDKQYDGELVFKVDNVTYIHPVTIPVSSTRVIDFDIVINSDYPEIDIKLFGQDKGFTSPQLNSITPDELLVGVRVDYGMLDAFPGDMNKKTYLFSFNNVNMPERLEAYESFNSILLPSLNSSSTGIIRKLYSFVQHSDGEDYKGVVLNAVLNKSHLVQPCIKPEIYKEFDSLSSPWNTGLKEMLLNFITIYALIAVLITLIFIWVRIKGVHNMIFIVSLLACIILIIVFLNGVYLRNSNIQTLMTVGERVVGNYEYIMVHNQKGDTVKFSSPYYKPIYKEQADKTPLKIRFVSGNGIAVEIPLGTRMVFESPAVQQ